MFRCSRYVGIVFLSVSLSSPQLYAAEGPTPPIDAIWKDVWKGALVEAEAAINRVDVTAHHNEIELLRGALLWEKHDYKHAIETLSRMRPVYDELQRKISAAKIFGGAKDQAASENELNYFRLYTYLALSKATSGQMDDDAESDFLRILSNPSRAEESTEGAMIVDTLNYFGAIEFSLGRYERALGSFLQVHDIWRINSLLNTEPAKSTEYNIACAYAKLRQADMAIVWLEKSLSLNPQNRWKKLLSDKDLDDIRHDKSFLDFIKGHNSDAR